MYLFVDIPDGSKSASKPQGGMGISMEEIVNKRLKPSAGVKRGSMCRRGKLYFKQTTLIIHLILFMQMKSLRLLTQQ